MNRYKTERRNSDAIARLVRRSNAEVEKAVANSPLILGLKAQGERERRRKNITYAVFYGIPLLLIVNAILSAL